jgi:hypothetical protein
MSLTDLLIVLLALAFFLANEYERLVSLNVL